MVKISTFDICLRTENVVIYITEATDYVETANGDLVFDIRRIGDDIRVDTGNLQLDTNWKKINRQN